MKTVQLRIGFYQPHIVNNPTRTFDQVLAAVEAIPDDESRAADVFGEPVRIQNLEVREDLWRGDLMRLRMNEDLRKGRRSGAVELIPFAEGEGLGENTAFIYHQPTNTFAFHEHRGGVGRSMLERYLKILGRVSRLDFRPMIRPRALQRVEAMHAFHSFEVHLADVPGAPAFTDSTESARTIFGMLAQFRAPKARIVLEVPKPRGGETVRATLVNVLDAVTGLIRPTVAQDTATDLDDRLGPVHKLVVVGQETADSADSMINLLEDRLFEYVPVTLESGRRLSDAQRFNATLTAWNIHRALIERYYTPI